jgi:hypothetical protein
MTQEAEALKAVVHNQFKGQPELMELATRALSERLTSLPLSLRTA